MPSPGVTYHHRIKEEKRLAAVEAATELFFEQGYERTSLQQIATRAGVSTATLFKRYPTKAALFEAIVERFWSLETECEATAIPSGDLEAGLLKFGHDYAQRMRRPEMASMFRLIIAESLRFPDLGQTLFNKGYGPFLGRLSTYLRNQVTQGNLLVVADIESASSAFLATIAGQVFWPELMAPGCGGTDADTKKVVHSAVATMLVQFANRPA